MRLTRQVLLIFQSDCGHSHAHAGIKSHLDALFLLPSSLPRYATIIDYLNFINFRHPNMVEQPETQALRQIRQLEEHAHSVGLGSVLVMLQVPKRYFAEHNTENFSPTKLQIGDTPDQTTWFLFEKPKQGTDNVWIERFQCFTTTSATVELVPKRESKLFGFKHALIEPFKAFWRSGWVEQHRLTGEENKERAFSADAQKCMMKYILSRHLIETTKGPDHEDLNLKAFKDEDSEEDTIAKSVKEMFEKALGTVGNYCKSYPCLLIG